MKPESISGLLRHSAVDIAIWIDERVAGYVKVRNKTYSGRSKLFMLFHGICRPLRCPTCGKETDRRIMSIWQDNEPFCCAKCASSFAESIEKGKKTKTELYGDPVYNNRDKFYDTVESMSPERKAKWKSNTIATMQEKYGADSYMETEEFREKSLSALHEKYGDEYSSYLQVPEIRAMSYERKLREHGDGNWSNHEKAIQTHFERTGYDTVFETPDFKEYVKEIMPEINSHRRDTMIRDFGRPFAFSSKYEYEGELFDSKPELAYWVWLRDTNTDFKRNRFDICLEYVYDGHTWEYFPDFMVEGRYVEVKGDQFFREDGTIFCPYGDKDMPDSEYDWICGKYEAKHQCMLDNGVVILRSREYSRYMEYVEGKYGKEFFGKCRRKSDIAGGK